MSKSDIRQTAYAITGEAHTITDNLVMLEEAAGKNSITISGFTEVTTTPSAGQFLVSYFYDALNREVGGLLEFNSADNNSSISVDYDGYGSIIWAKDFNAIVENQDSTPLPLQGQAGIISMPAGTKESPIVEGVLYGQTLIQNVVNGGFGNGTTGWVAVNSTNFLVTDGIATFNATTSTGYIYTEVPTIENHKIFYISKVKATKSVIIQDYGSNLDTYVTYSNYNNWDFIYGTKVASSTSTGRRTYIRSLEADNDVSVDYLMMIDQTALGIESKTEAQMLELIRAGYFEEMESVKNPILLSEGKNLFNIDDLSSNSESNTSLVIDGNKITIDETSETGGVFVGKIKIEVEKNTTYTASWDDLTSSTSGTGLIYIYQGGTGVDPGERGTQLTSQGLNVESRTFTTNNTDEGCIYIGFYLSSSHTANNPITVENFQLTKGTTAPIKYYLYDKKQLKAQATLRSVPNGTKDEINILTRKKTKKVEEYVLQSGDMTLLNATATYQYVKIPLSNLSGIVAQTTSINGSTLVAGFSNEYPADQSAGTNDWVTDIDNLYLTFPLSTYPDLSTAQTALAGTVIQYELATPVEENITITGQIIAYENGRLLQYNGYTNAHTADGTGKITLAYAISEVDELYYFDTNGDKVIVTSYTLASDGLSITGLTATTSYHVTGVSKSQVYADIDFKVSANTGNAIGANTQAIGINGKQIADISEDVALLIVLST